VDPTRVLSRASVAFDATDFPGDAFVSGVLPKFVVGVGAWSLTFETRFASLSSGLPGASIVSGVGDAGFTVLNAFHVKGPHALAAAGKVVVPLGNSQISRQAVTFTPSFTWAFTLSPEMLVAIQPQYTWSLLHADAVPPQSLITVRSFLAMFRPSGWFYVGEVRLLQDFEADQFDVVLSPIVGKNLGRGFNLSALAEVPVTSDGRDLYGVTGKVGVQKAF
jgi:hypothetical protein